MSEYVAPEEIIPFEDDYEQVKLDPNGVWNKYEAKIINIVKGLSYWKNFDREELLQQAYIYFIDFCAVYDPYYNGNFFPFDKFLFKNLIIKLRAFIQRYYFKQKREQPTEFSEYNTSSQARNNILEADEKIYTEFIYSLITDRQRQILELTLKGYKQQEIGDMLDISQSRVSVIKKKTLNSLKDKLEALQAGKTVKKKRRTRVK